MSTQENALVNLLRQVKGVLDKYNIEFWLDCGTLLGAVREEKFLAWEHDIDLGAWQEKVSDSVKISISREFSDSGFAVYIAKDYINYMSIKKREVVLDINFYCLSNDKAIMSRLTPKNLMGKYLLIFLMVLSVSHYYEVDFRKKFTTSFRSVLCMMGSILPFLVRSWIVKIVLAIYKKIGSKDTPWVVPSRYFMNLSTIKFYGMKIKVPAETEEYLTYRYGKDWRIPKKEWVTERDDGAVISPLE